MLGPLVGIVGPAFRIIGSAVVLMQILQHIQMIGCIQPRHRIGIAPRIIPHAQHGGLASPLSNNLLVVVPHFRVHAGVEVDRHTHDHIRMQLEGRRLIGTVVSAHFDRQIRIGFTELPRHPVDERVIGFRPAETGLLVHLQTFAAFAVPLIVVDAQPDGQSIRMFFHIFQNVFYRDFRCLRIRITRLPEQPRAFRIRQGGDLFSVQHRHHRFRPGIILSILGKRKSKSREFVAEFRAVPQILHPPRMMNAECPTDGPGDAFNINSLRRDSQIFQSNDFVGYICPLCSEIISGLDKLVTMNFGVIGAFFPE